MKKVFLSLLICGIHIIGFGQSNASDNNVPPALPPPVAFPSNLEQVDVLKNLIIPNTLKSTESLTITVKLKKQHRWVSTILKGTEDKVISTVEDNGVNDNEPKRGVITFELKGNQFPTTGLHEFHIVSYNKPVQTPVLAEYLSDKSAYKIIIE